MINAISTCMDARQHREPSSRLAAGLVQNGGQRIGLLSVLFPLGSVLLLLFGCAVGPNYQRPKVNISTEYRDAGGSAQQASVADLPWWEVFKDEKLRNLVQTALANNYDLQIAVTRVEQSRQIAAQARAQYFPFVNYSVTASDGKNEFVGTVSPNSGQERGAFAGVATVAWKRTSGAGSGVKTRRLALSISPQKKPAAA